MCANIVFVVVVMNNEWYDIIIRFNNINWKWGGMHCQIAFRIFQSFASFTVDYLGNKYKKHVKKNIIVIATIPRPAATGSLASGCFD